MLRLKTGTTVISKNAPYTIGKIVKYHPKKPDLMYVDLAINDKDKTYVVLCSIDMWKPTGRVEYETDTDKKDIAEVVRCKNCKHLIFKDFSAYCPFKLSECSPNHFCAYGERRED